MSPPLTSSLTSSLTSQASPHRLRPRAPVNTPAKATHSEPAAQAKPKSFAAQLREARAQDRSTEQVQAHGQGRETGQTFTADSAADKASQRTRADLFTPVDNPKAAASPPDPALASDAQRLDQARQSDARAFGFAELGVLGRGFGAGAPSEPTPRPGGGAPLGAQGAAPSASDLPPRAQIPIPADPAPVTEAGARIAPGPLSEARVNRSLSPAIDPAWGQPPAEATSASGDPEVETIDGAGAPAGPRSRPRATQAAASVLVAETDGQLHVLIGTPALSADEETSLRRGVEAAIAETGARPGEVHVNGRAASRPAPPTRQG